MVALFIGGMVYARAAGSETTEETTPTTATATTTTTNAQAATSTKKTTTKNAPSDTLLTGLLAAGAVLILSGALYGRITSIKILGAEVGLTKDETDTTVKQATEQLEDKPKEEVAEVLPKVLDHVRAEKRKAGVAEMSPSDLSRVVTEAVKTID